MSCKGLFAEYEKAFAALDIEKSATFFADTFISAGPRGAPLRRAKPEFLKLAHRAAEFYKSVGQTSARILSLQETADKQRIFTRESSLGRYLSENGY